jgi:hypothetical protein
MVECSLDSDSLDSKDPIFLLSTERSGSNLVRSILGTHTALSAPHPLETAYPWGKVVPPKDLPKRRVRNLFRDILTSKHYSFHPLETPVDIDRVVDRFLSGQQSHSLLDVQDAIYTEYAAQERTDGWVSKYPALWDCLDDALEYYDDLKIIYNVRDARDVALSFKSSNVWRYHPFYTATRWQQEQRRGTELLEDHPESVHQIRYKDLLQDPESVIRGMCDFLEIPFEQEMLYYHETDEAQAAAESAEVFENLSSPIMSDNYDKFRQQLPDDEVRLVEKIAADQLEYFHYELTYSEPERECFEFDLDRYESEDKMLNRQAAFRDWHQSPQEQIKRQMTKSFAGYMIFRYGIVEKLLPL